MKKYISPMILSTSPEAATRKAVTGWVDVHGRFWGEDERMARYSSCTHVPCRDCGEPVTKEVLRCAACHDRHEVAQYWKRKPIEWSANDPVWSLAKDAYYSTYSDALKDMEPEEREADLRLVPCYPVHARELDIDDFSDGMPDGVDMPDEVYAAMEIFNKAVAGVILWYEATPKERVKCDMPSEHQPQPLEVEP